MMEGWLRRGLVLLLLVSAVDEIRASTRRALLIGNDNYPGNRLQNAGNDARAMADRLTSLGYIVTLAIDVDRRDMATGIASFTQSFTEGDIAFVFYAGHGLQVDGENYLVPTDFQASNPTSVKSQGYGLSMLLDQLTERGASTQIIVLDACRDNPFLRSRSVSSGWAPIISSAGSFLAFGTAPGSTASDQPQTGHGLFTEYLLRYLTSPLAIEQMFQKVRQDVVVASQGDQVPWTSSSLIGSFHVDPQWDASAAPLLGLSTMPKSAAGNVRQRSFSSQEPSIEKAGLLTVQNAAQESSMLNNALVQLRGLHFSQALPVLQAVLAFDPHCALALRLLSATLGLLGRGVEGIRTLDRAIELNPADAPLYSYRCVLKISADTLGAEVDCRTALRIQKSLPQAHLGLAISLYQQKRFDEAYEEASLASALDPKSSAALFLRSSIATTGNYATTPQQDYVTATVLAAANGK